VSVVSDSSSCGGYESAESDTSKWEDLRMKATEKSLQELNVQDTKIEQSTDEQTLKTSTKKSFWKMLTGNNGNKKKENIPKQ